MKLYREETIAAILSAIDRDQYDDEEQDIAVEKGDFAPFADYFLHLFMKGQMKLEIGCGSGSSIPRRGFTHAIEPNSKRHQRAANANPRVRVKRGGAEVIAERIASEI